MGGSKWLKVKIALGLKLNSCVYVPRTTEDSPAPSVGRFYDAVLSPPPPLESDIPVQAPKHSSKSSKNVCAICLSTMKLGRGHAIFTAECSHSFHFHCIASNAKRGKQSCPVCRAKWKEIPFQSPASEKLYGQPGIISNPAQLQQEMSITSPRADHRRPSASVFRVSEPPVFNDDDEVAPNSYGCDGFGGAIEVEMYPEVSAVPKSKALDEFSILVHLKAPITVKTRNSCWNPQASRAPVDIITVLDVSGSMAGTKLALLKRAMGFVIQNLGYADRLSVIAFSSTARRLFPLRRMTDDGKQEALQAVNALTSNGGTNIAEGLRKAAKILTDCRWKNPIASIILLSDGRDTYTKRTPPDGNSSSTHQTVASGFKVPVHVFGFGVDHDAISMHIISENSGGTFSFIESESVIQDSFAQCIGGLLSVVVQELLVEVECVDPMVRLVSIKSGSYKTFLSSDKRKAVIEVGDLYAEEERDFLVMVDIPVQESSNETSLIRVKCQYKHPVGKSNLSLDFASDVKIQRPVSTGDISVSMEVDRQRNRLRSAEAMSEASAAAERGELTLAASVLENCRKALSETVSARAGEKLCMALDSELREMGERMASRQTYETSGRAYVLSGLSSHSWQRATTRGDSTDWSSLVQSYQTPSMVDMVNLSQTTVSGSSTRASIRPTRLLPR